MALREELGRQGDWLFRWRSYLPLCMVPLFFISLWDSTKPDYLLTPQIDRALSLFCLLLSFAGLFIRSLTIGYASPGTSGGDTKRQKANSLNTTGIYSTARHPLYFGNFLIFLGIVMFVKVWWFVILSILAYLLYYERIMYREEEFLREKFGDEFIRWAEKTPAFIPRFKNWLHPQVPFSMRKVIYREYTGFAEIIACFTLIKGAKNYLLTGSFILSKIWIFFFTAGLIAYFCVKFIKKITKASWL